MNILVCDIIRVKTDLNIKHASLDILLSQSDIISLHLPLTKKTRHMISHDEFRKMKDGTIIINACRGGIVDEKALLHSLESGKVRAAAIDVFEKEPTDNFSLVNHPNVIATPHIGSATKEGQKRAGFEVVNLLKSRYIC